MAFKVQTVSRATMTFFMNPLFGMGDVELCALLAVWWMSAILAFIDNHRWSKTNKVPVGSN